MRALLAIVLLAALAAPSFAHGYGYGHGYARGCGRGYRVARYRHSRPYWHHPYYARFGYQRPYLYYRQLRSFGYVSYWGGPRGGCGGYGYGYGYYYTYYSPYVSVAPVYSRLGVALTLDDPVFAKAPRADADGLPRVRTEPVGSRFLVPQR